MESKCAKKIVLLLLMMMMKVEGSSRSLAESLWGSEEALKVREEAWQSKFVKGVVNGSLDPQFYAKYSLQDAYWVVKVGQFWGYVSQHASDPRLRQFAAHSTNSWLTSGRQMLRQLSLSLNGIVPSHAAASYLGFIENAKASEYVLIATYPCAKLWPYLAQRCNNSIPSPPMHENVYIEWCHQDPGSSLHNQEQLIDAFYVEGKILHHEAMPLFLKGLKHEVSFFNHA